MDLPQGAAKNVRVRTMFDAIAPRYDLLNRIITLGLDQRWRRRCVDSLGLPPGSLVLDLACGTGDLSVVCHQRGYQVVGADFSGGMLGANRAPAPLLQADGAALALAEGSFDAVVCGYALRNFADLAGVIQEMARILRPGGRLALLEVASPPPGPLQMGFSLWFEHVVPWVGSVLSDKEAYHYLPRSTAYLPGAPALRAMLRHGGFTTVGHRLLQGGLSQLCTATRSGMPAQVGTATARPGARD